MVIAMVMRMKNGINTREAKREKLDEPLQTSGLLNYLLLRLLDVGLTSTSITIQLLNLHF